MKALTVPKKAPHSMHGEHSGKELPRATDNIRLFKLSIVFAMVMIAKTELFRTLQENVQANVTTVLVVKPYIVLATMLAAITVQMRVYTI